MATVSLGSGVLAWHPDDRRTVYLARTPDGHPSRPVDIDPTLAVQHGRLVAVILATHGATRTGDNGRRPCRAEITVGEHITLGTGSLILKRTPEGTVEIQLIPDPGGGGGDWLDAGALYRCYEQIVRLDFRTDSDISDITSISASTEES